jgi:uncharacterized membrane protein YgcG
MAIRQTFIKRVFSLFILIIAISTCAEASFILHNEGILTQKTSDKIEEIGAELKKKTGITVYLSAKKSLNKVNIVDYSKKLSSMFKDNEHAILLFAQYEKKVDTIATSNVTSLFDKDSVLNDYTIPLIVSHDKNSENSRYNAGLLNGYSELCEQIAKSKSITLDSAIGDESSSIIGIIRTTIYSMIVIFTVYYFYLRIFRRKNG